MRTGAEKTVGAPGGGGGEGVVHYSRSCGRSGPRRSPARASEGTSRRLSEGLETGRLGTIPEEAEEEEEEEESET